MKKKFIASIIASLAVLILVDGKAANILLSFVLVGVVPGTHIVLPYWVMMAGYCTVITLIVAYYLEITLKFYYRHKVIPAAKPKMPRRRYSTL